MTETEMWQELDRLCSLKAQGMLDIIRVLREGHKKHHRVICAIRHVAPDLVNQLYMNLDEANPTREGNRYMLCYTTWAEANSDMDLPEPCEDLPLDFVIGNALSKPVIGGLLFNRHHPGKMMAIPKQFLGDAAMAINAYQKVFEGKSGPFMFNEK